MNNDLLNRIMRDNELYKKKDMGIELTNQEREEMRVIRDEILNYCKLVLDKNEKK